MLYQPQLTNIFDIGRHIPLIRYIRRNIGDPEQWIWSHPLNVTYFYYPAIVDNSSLEIKFLIPSYKRQMSTMTKTELSNDQNEITEQQKLAEFIQDVY